MRVWSPADLAGEGRLCEAAHLLPPPDHSRHLTPLLLLLRQNLRLLRLS